MLQAGLTPELIDTLTTISNQMPNQRAMVQFRLLEETLKVLGGNSKPVIHEPDYLYSWAKHGERVIQNVHPSSSLPQNNNSLNRAQLGMSLRGQNVSPALTNTASGFGGLGLVKSRSMTNLNAATSGGSGSGGGGGGGGGSGSGGGGGGGGGSSQSSNTTTKSTGGFMVRNLINNNT
jgi:uncharacterized membrane protein YgcG